MSTLEKAWYSHSPLVWLLFPLALLYRVVTALRRLAYRSGLFRSYAVDATVVIVGNVSVGGNGKTPLVMRLVELLRQQGYHPGVLSRGYGGSGVDYPCDVDPHHQASEVGDEPRLMRQHLKCPIVVDPDRVRGAQHLATKHKCDVILCDDGLQHYRLKRDVEMIVMDGERRLGNGHLLPMGPLREGEWRLNTVDFIVVNGGIARKGSYLMTLQTGRFVNIKYPTTTRSVQEMQEPVIAVAGIGNPQRFYNTLSTKGVIIGRTVSFADHHGFVADDIPQGTVVMTEKDAVKCAEIAHDDCWYLPVSATLTPEFQQAFMNKIASIKKTKR